MRYETYEIINVHEYYINILMRQFNDDKRFSLIKKALFVSVPARRMNGLPGKQ